MSNDPNDGERYIPCNYCGGMWEMDDEMIDGLCIDCAKKDAAESYCNRLDIKSGRKDDKTRDHFMAGAEWAWGHPNER